MYRTASSKHAPAEGALMNLFLLTPDDKIFDADGDGAAHDVFRLPASQALHAHNVLRVAVADHVKVGLLNGRTGTGTVVVAEPGGEIRVSVQWSETAATIPRFELWLAIPRPKALARILRDAPTLGIRKIVLFRSARVDKSYLESPILTPALYRPLLHEGLMQARTTHEPTVDVEPLFRPFLEDRAKARIGACRAYLVHPHAAFSLGQVCRSRAIEDAIVMIGPEGGFVPFEVSLADSVGLHTVHLGPRILRVEIAVAAALSVLGATDEVAR
jgi:16S rRNA (uracil1498-N3)-methyltransferase